MTRRTAAFLLATAFAATAVAQDGVSTASAARAKYLGDRGAFPVSREIAVEDFVNYHRHELPRPKSGRAVAMDVRWGNGSVRDGRGSVLQVGFSTALANDRKQLRPLNLALVIDKSGSMADRDKLVRVKQALLALLDQLRPTDTLSLVAFDSEADVLVPARKLGDKQVFQRMIRRLEPGRSTNIEAGLTLGYKEALGRYNRESTNRVILLTDGIANQGVTDPDEIARGSKGFNERGIDLSTIGVGEVLDRDLLRTLAKSGRGLFHFIGDTEDVTKVFVKEFQSLVSPVAADPVLEVNFDPGLDLEQVYGFEPRMGRDSVRVPLDDMNSGMTEVVLMRFAHRAGRESFPVNVKLTYRDLETGKTVTMKEVTELRTGQTGRKGELDDPLVAKNFTIALLAQSIKDMARFCEEGQYSQAEKAVAASTSLTLRRYPNLDDEDIKRNFETALKYRDLLRERYPSSRDTAEVDRKPLPDAPAKLDSRNLIPNGDFSLGDTGFTSERRYAPPITNCLWGGYYTIARAFNQPEQLHTNVPSLPYAAPDGGQVLWMNTGCTEAFTLWSAKVRCRPHTRYRVSFKEIGLSGGRDWINSYEIRVNGDRSEAQLGGDGAYVTVSYVWDSGSSSEATVSIVRLPKGHIGGVVGIANIEMVRES